MSRVTFKVDTDRLNNDAQRLMNDIQRIMTEVAAINEEVNALSGMWKGKANTALTQSFNESHEWMLKSLDTFSKYTNQLIEDKTDYEVCDAKATELVSGI